MFVFRCTQRCRCRWMKTYRACWTAGKGRGSCRQFTIFIASATTTRPTTTTTRAPYANITHKYYERHRKRFMVALPDILGEKRLVFPSILQHMLYEVVYEVQCMAPSN